MNDWSSGYVEANGIRIHYYRTGGDKPQVVLNHGAMDDGLCWTRVAKALEQDYDLIMFDARGHGLSDSGEGDYGSEARAGDLAEAISALGLDRPVVGGHSLGADGSMQLAALYPEIPRAIFMEDPPIAMPGEPMFGGDQNIDNEKAFKMMFRMMSLIKAMPVFVGKGIAMKLMPVSPDDEVVPWVMSKKRVNEDFLQAMKGTDLRNDAPFETAEKVKVPALLLMGDREKGAIVSQAVAQEMSKVMPGLKVAHLAGATHDIRRSKFEEYMNALRAFLNQAYS